MPAEPTARMRVGRLRVRPACPQLTGLSQLYMNVGHECRPFIYYTASAQYRGVLGKGAQGAAAARWSSALPQGPAPSTHPVTGSGLIRIHDRLFKNKLKPSAPSRSAPANSVQGFALRNVADSQQKQQTEFQGAFVVYYVFSL